MSAVYVVDGILTLTSVCYRPETSFQAPDLGFSLGYISCIHGRITTRHSGSGRAGSATSLSTVSKINTATNLSRHIQLLPIPDY